MESSRLNIMREKPPSVVFNNRGNGFTAEAEVGKKIQLDAQVEVVGQSLDMDENGNEVIRYTLKILRADILKVREARHDAASRR